ncbi:MAG: H-NS histone family protein [Comamonadaceae bacterium]|nr:H-NS histone family protein [Comamonadaceae bacterium]
MDEVLAALQSRATAAPKRTSSRSTGNVPAKYRDPASGTEWSGRGRKPLWVQAHLSAGGQLLRP